MTYEELRSELYWEIRKLWSVTRNDAALEQLLMKAYELGYKLGEENGYGQGYDAAMEDLYD